MAITTNALVSGLVGGLVATVVMTVVMMVAGDGSPPPTAQLVAKFGGGSPADYRVPGMVLHLLYGVGTGAVLAALAGAVGFVSYDTLVAGFLCGVVYGVVLPVVGTGCAASSAASPTARRDAVRNAQRSSTARCLASGSRSASCEGDDTVMSTRYRPANVWTPPSAEKGISVRVPYLTRVRRRDHSSL